MAEKQEILNRWRLVLGKYAADQISFSQGTAQDGSSETLNYVDMEQALDFLYGREYGEEQEIRTERHGGSEGSKLTVPYWQNQEIISQAYSRDYGARCAGKI